MRLWGAEIAAPRSCRTRPPACGAMGKTFWPLSADYCAHRAANRSPADEAAAVYRTAGRALSIVPARRVLSAQRAFLSAVYQPRQLTAGLLGAPIRTRRHRDRRR